MNKFMPYIKTAATVIVILIGYKFLVQPHLPASVKNYFPSV